MVASLFGSRVDTNKMVTDNSDINFLIKLKNQMRIIVLKFVII